MSGRLLALMYHGLHADADAPGFDPRYSVTPAAFAQQLSAVRVHGSPAWDPAEDRLPDAGDGALPVLITFDDGAATDASVALPLLQRHGLRALFCITSDYIGRPGMLAPAGVRALADAGMTIGAHGKSHRFLTTLPDAELLEELRVARDVLEQLTGRIVDALALPGGRGDARVCAAARRIGYRWILGSQPGANAAADAARPLQRLAVTRDVGAAAFAQWLDWKGPAVSRLCWRHRLLALPKRVLGDVRYDRLREAWVR